MVAGTSERARVRRCALRRTLECLEDGELRARVEQSYEDGERTIEEWHEFVQNLDLALKEMRRGRKLSRT